MVGEDLGTVAEGFRPRLTRANILGMRVLWFERKGAEVLPPAGYPPLSVACVATHDLATLAGWWVGADIAERLSLGLITLRAAGEAIAARLEEKRGLIAALLSEGVIASSPGADAPLDDATAAAVHALIGGSASLLASAQFDDLVGQTVATNLPGTDRERPNWRLKLGPDVAAAFAGGRARAVIAALAKGRLLTGLLFASACVRCGWTWDAGEGRGPPGEGRGTAGEGKGTPGEGKGTPGEGKGTPAEATSVHESSIFKGCALSAVQIPVRPSPRAASKLPAASGARRNGLDGRTLGLPSHPGLDI